MNNFITIFREKATSALAGLYAVLYPGQIGIWNAGFCGERKAREPREKTLEQCDKQQQIQPTYI